MVCLQELRLKFGVYTRPWGRGATEFWFVCEQIFLLLLYPPYEVRTGDTITGDTMV